MTDVIAERGTQDDTVEKVIAIADVPVLESKTLGNDTATRSRIHTIDDAMRIDWLSQDELDWLIQAVNCQPH